MLMMKKYRKRRLQLQSRDMIVEQMQSRNELMLNTILKRDD